MRTRIENILLKLRITPNLKGFNCICEVVEMILKEPDIKLMDCYSLVGQKLGIDASSVERVIRHCVKKIDLNEWEKIGGSGTKNSEFIYTLALILKREGVY